MYRFCFLISAILFYIHWCPSVVLAGPDNIASQAAVTSSSSLDLRHSASKVTDGIISVPHQGEWACLGETVFWGYIKYPWIKLEWDEEKTINKIILYDRPILEEHLAGGTIFFSDGSEVVVTEIPNNGRAKLVSFAPKKTKWIKFQATDGDGKNLGLSEIEVFAAPANYPDYSSWVDPFIETTRGRYFFFTPGSLPFGMIATAPHTRMKNQWGGGYNYNSTDILGFGQLHGWMMAGIDIMPTTGLIDPTLGRNEWKSAFSHDDEIAQPGYHRVYLHSYDTWVENTVTNRVSFYRFTYTQEAMANILINLGGYVGSTTMIKAQVRRKNDHQLEGSFASSGRMWGGPNEIKVFFAITFDQPYQALDGWNDEDELKDIAVLEGPSEMQRMDSMTFGSVTQSYWSAPSAGVTARYNMHAGEKLQMKIAISYTSIENAWANLKDECDHWDFDRIRKDARKQWNEWLGKIHVEGGTANQKTKFYTDLWHVLLGRQIIDDVNGDYPDYTQGLRNWNFTDAELKIKTLPKNNQGSVKYHMYNSDALWLTQWNLNILWGLAWPSVLDDFSASMIQYADNGGLLPRGPCVGGYSYIMTGCPATNMIVSAFMKNQLTKQSPRHALATIVRNHLPGGMMGNMDELSFYMTHGWCPENAGKSIEWYFQDWSAAQMAKRLGEEQLFQQFTDRARQWKKIFHSGQKLIFPKSRDSLWLHEDPLSGHGWVEANAWQATWSLSHDLQALATMMGGPDECSEKLNYAFEQAAENDFVFGYGNGYVSYANQPGCSNAHVFNRIGKPWLSQYWVRRVNEQAYGGVTPDRGYGGHDEDQGQMGGVSALMSIGLFSVQGNCAQTPIYEITSPVFDEISITLDSTYYDGTNFTIRTYNNSAENTYIQEAKLNGKTHSAAWISHEDFGKGGILELWLGPHPNKEWGLAPFPD